MEVFKKESLELLRSRIDLVEALEPHLALKRAGASYKACCPFHDEKTPSFIVKRGDSHYHCFGCGAHGDAIAFFMNYLKMSFHDAIEHLAEKFGVVLEHEEGRLSEGVGIKKKLKEALEKAAAFFHYCLLNTSEGHVALEYLYKRGMTLEFIKTFRLGWAPDTPDLLMRYLRKEKIEDQIAEQAGLIKTTQAGFTRDFFSDRITFPILDPTGAVIAFSARKIKEQTFGGKYINTPETPLFKKSSVLFGLSYSRRRIAKEQKAIIVEGQVDALRLIHEGFDYTVAGQGTAFGEGHVKGLIDLGVRHVYLALDGDDAGQAAAVKIGDLFQKKGVEVSVVALPRGSDPDSLLQEIGPDGFSALLEKSERYLSFLISTLSKTYDITSPSGKHQLVQAVSKQIRAWEEPVVVHESLKKVAELLHVPENLMQVDAIPIVPIKKAAPVSKDGFDPDKVIESDLLRWLVLAGESEPQVALRIQTNLAQDDFRHPLCRKLFTTYFELLRDEKPRDLLSLGMELNSEEEERFLNELMQKKIALNRLEEGVEQAILKLLMRSWMEKRETLRQQMQETSLSEEEALELARTFDALKKHPPVVK